MPSYRGICVASPNPGAGRACWDVCNFNHLPIHYSMGDTAPAPMQFGVKGMIESVRAGLNPLVKCPGNFGGDPCPPGSACPKEMSDMYSVSAGRGMCVLDESQPQDRACWDMCDSSKSPVSFTMGTPPGTESKVRGVRGSSRCPGTQWWKILLLILGIFLIIGCIVGAIVVVRNQKKKSKSSSRRQDEDDRQQDYSTKFLEDGAPMDRQVYDQPPINQDQPPYDDYGAPSPQQDRGFAMPPSPPPDGGYHTDRAALMEEYGPPPTNFVDTPAPQREQPPQEPSQPPQQQSLQAYQQQNFEGSRQPSVAMGGGSMGTMSMPSASVSGTARIPGLDEPNLLGNLQMMQQQQQAGSMEGFQTNPYAMIPQNTQPGSAYMTPGSGAVLQNSFNFAPPGGQPSGLNSFHTQIPSLYPPGSPPSSVQVRPGVGGQQFFGQQQQQQFLR